MTRNTVVSGGGTGMGRAIAAIDMLFALISSDTIAAPLDDRWWSRAQLAGAAIPALPQHIRTAAGLPGWRS
jgi:hypothetical protein